MKAKLLIEGKEIEVEISEEEYNKLQTKQKKTGYERIPESDIYFYANSRGCVEIEDYYDVDNEYYESANYYSSKTVAENNARADKLMRQLRRFSVEHREYGFTWHDINTDNKYYIYFNFNTNEIDISINNFLRPFGVIHFDSKETAQAAIDEFHDELIWYFTEYKDSL